MPLLPFVARCYGGGSGDSGGSMSTGAGDAGAESTDVTEPPGDETSAACQDGQAEACCCFAASDSCEAPTVACFEVAICDEVVVVPTSQTDVEVMNPGALDCALDALHDRTPGKLVVTRHDCEAGEWPCGCTSSTFLYVRADGSAFEHRSERCDGASADPLVLRALAEPSVFGTCQSDSNPMARLNCIEHATIGDVLETCFGSCSSG